MKKAILFSFLFGAVLQCPALGDNWAHWRGDGGNGVASGAQPPTEWSSTTNVKWKVAIPGRGSGSPMETIRINLI